MPVITIQESTGRTKKQRRKVVEGITQAFIMAYDIPPESVTIFFTSFAGDEWAKAGKLREDP